MMFILHLLYKDARACIIVLLNFHLLIDESYVLPSCVVNGTAISKTFQILYRNEDVAINDLVMYRLHTLVDANKVGVKAERKLIFIVSLKYCRILIKCEELIFT